MDGDEGYELDVISRISSAVSNHDDDVSNENKIVLTAAALNDTTEIVLNAPSGTTGDHNPVSQSDSQSNSQSNPQSNPQPGLNQGDNPYSEMFEENLQQKNKLKKRLIKPQTLFSINQQNQWKWKEQFGELLNQIKEFITGFFTKLKRLVRQNDEQNDEQNQQENQQQNEELIQLEYQSNKLSGFVLVSAIILSICNITYAIYFFINKEMFQSDHALNLSVDFLKASVKLTRELPDSPRHMYILLTILIIFVVILGWGGSKVTFSQTWKQWSTAVQQNPHPPRVSVAVSTFLLLVICAALDISSVIYLLVA